MEKTHLLKAPNLKKINELATLVENKSVFTMNQCELNIFETHEKSENVKLKFNDFVLTSMLKGKKVMHIYDTAHFEYLPGETVILPANEAMVIDFPEACEKNPTQCLALTLDNVLMQETLDMLNEYHPKIETKEVWKVDLNFYHLKNNFEISNTLNRLLEVSKETNKGKDLIANFTLKELLIRLMQTQAKQFLLENYQKHTSTHRFAFIIQYIHEHLSETITIEHLSKLACMSKPNFFKCFKRELGISPIEFIIQERIKEAKKLLIQKSTNITDACYRVGFSSLSHFVKVFKKIEGITPKDFKKKYLGIENQNVQLYTL